MQLHSVTVPIQDRPGSMADVMEILRDAYVPVRAFTVDRDHFQFITDDGDAAVEALRGASVDCTRHAMEEIRIPDRPGGLAVMLRDLAEHGVNIQAGFGVANGSTGRVYVRVDDMDRAAPVLRRHSGEVVLAPGLGRIA